MEAKNVDDILVRSMQDQSAGLPPTPTTPPDTIEQKPIEVEPPKTEEIKKDFAENLQKEPEKPIAYLGVEWLNNLLRNKLLKPLKNLRLTLILKNPGNNNLKHLLKIPLLGVKPKLMKSDGENKKQ